MRMRKIKRMCIRLIQFEIEPLSSSLRLGNMVGGLGWLRRRVCTWWCTLFLEVTDIYLDGTFENFASHGTDATRRDKY